MTPALALSRRCGSRQREPSAQPHYREATDAGASALMIAVRRGLAVLAGMLAVAACGGSEGALSREQFAREANEICVRANEKVRMLGPEPPILTAEKADWI